jgi:hypothetical protein
MKTKTKPRRPYANGRANSKLGHVPILDEITYRRLSEIMPSPENDTLYKPVDPADPDFKALGESVRRDGVREALIVTRDDYIVSGHRRYAAAQSVGLERVPCRVASIYRDDPRFLALVRECNRQRVKTLDEVLREEIVGANADDAYAALVQYRQRAACIDVETGVIEGTKHRAKITEAKKPFLDAIARIVERLRNYWPLSDRLIHYQLLNDPPLIHASKPDSVYANDHKSYKSLCELLTRARIAGRIPFQAIHDPTRPVTTWKVHGSVGPFIRGELKEFLAGYARDLTKSQPNHVEIIGEKNTIGGIIHPVAADYGIPYTLGRGYSSLPPRHDMAQRYQRSGKEQLVLLFLSDFDPEGEDIPHSFARSMRDDFGIDKVEYIKVGLTREQVEELHLQPGLTAKEGSSRRERFVEQHGEHVFELEAVEPERLQTMLRQTIESVLDMALFTAEQAKEKEDARYLSGVRKTVNDMLATLRLEQD